MAITPIPFQALNLQSLQSQTINTGSNLVVNGRFDADLSSWTPANISWQAGTAAYVWVEGCYIGQLDQVIALTERTRYKLQFKYKATKDFILQVHVRDQDSDEQVLPDYSQTANTNGLWNTVTLYFNNKINRDIVLSLYCFSQNDAGGDSCAGEGYSEDGFFFDNVTIYAQKKTYSCGSCDKVIMDRSRPIEFQVKFDPSIMENLLTNGDLATNPFDAVTLSLDSFGFDITTLPSLNTEFSIYICGKVFRFTYIAGGLPGSGYTVSINGNIYDFTVSYGGGGSPGLAGFQASLAQAMVDYIDDLCGTTTLMVPNTFGVFDAPGDVFISDPSAILSNVFTSTPSNVFSDNFVYDETGKRICYHKFAFANNNYSFDHSLVADTIYKFALDYDSSFSDFALKLKLDDGVNPIREFPFTIGLGTGTASVIFTALETGSTNFIIELTDAAGNNSGLCLDNLSLIKYGPENFIEKIELIDCRSEATEIQYGTQIYSTSFLLQINNNDFPIDTPIQVVLTDIEGNVFASQPIDMLDFDTRDACIRQKLMKLNWTDSCAFGDIDYKNLPFTNEIYIKGYVQKAPLDKKDRTMQTNANTGALKTIYNHSVGKAELKTHLYSPDTHAMLERVFEHGSVFINDKGYYLDDGGNYTVNPIGNGYFTARVDLVESGTEMVKTTCCC